jgi:4-amino-4-deoxy-L-arabinose transferase-like glycosyltransferase
MPRSGPDSPRRAPPSRKSSAPRPSRLAVLGMVAVALLALVLRLRGVRSGLPDFLDEAVPFRRALSMWDPLSGRVDWDPHFFHYPSLTLYLNLLLQQAHLVLGQAMGWFASPADYAVSFQTDASPMVIPARLMALVFDLACVGAVVALGERLRRGAGLLAGALVAASATLIVSARTIESDTFMAALVVLAVERMLAWRARGGTSRLVLAVVLAGLAAGAKYPGAVVLVPLALAMWSRDGTRGLVRWPLCAAGAGAVFLLTSPYVVLDMPTFLRDLGLVRGIASAGHLGDLDRAGAAFHARTLVRDLGWMAPALLAAAVLTALVRGLRRRGAAVAGGEGRTAAGGPARPGRPGERAVLWACVLVFGVPIALARVEAERYMVPVLPFVALLAADAALDLVALARGRARAQVAGALAVALAAALLVPALITGIGAATADPYASRLQARRWIESHLGPHDLLLQEGYAGAVLERVRAGEMRASAVFAAASPRVREAYLARREMNAVTIPLAVVGSTTTTVQPASGPPITLSVVPHPADLNQAVYDPRLLDGVDYVATSGAVRGRFEADPKRFDVAMRFYALLDSTAEVAATFGSVDGRSGPLITFYRLGARTRTAVAALGPLPTLWWAQSIRPTYQIAYERAVLPPEERGSEAMLGPDGEPVPWVRSLDGLFAQRYGSFAQWLAMELIERGAPDPARRLAWAVATMDAHDVTACLTAADACIQVAAWKDAAWVLTRTESAVEERGDEVPSLLRMQRAGVLQQTGDLAGARAELERVRSGPDPELAARAEHALAGSLALSREPPR